MKKAISAVLSFAFLVSFSPVVGSAQAASCPDVDAAKAMLKQTTARTDEEARKLLQLMGMPFRTN